MKSEGEENREEWRVLKRPWRPRRPKPRSKCWTRRKKPLRIWHWEVNLLRHFALFSPDNPAERFLALCPKIGIGTDRAKKILACVEDSVKRSAKGRKMLSRARVGCDRLTASISALSDIHYPSDMRGVPAEETYHGVLENFLAGRSAETEAHRRRMALLHEHFTTPEEITGERDEVEELIRSLDQASLEDALPRFDMSTLMKLRQQYWMRGRPFPVDK